MSVEIPEGFGQCSIRYNLSGDIEPMYVTFGFENGPLDTDPTLVANIIQGHWTDATSIGAAGTRYTHWSIGPSLVTLGTATGPVTGPGNSVSAGTAGAGNTLPQNCAILTRKQTARGGRRGRGRCYIPCATFQEGDVDNTGTILPAVVTNLQGRINAFLSLMGVSGYDVQLLHGEGLGGTPPPPPDPVLSWIVQSRIATQRRRLRP